MNPWRFAPWDRVVCAQCVSGLTAAVRVSDSRMGRVRAGPRVGPQSPRRDERSPCLPPLRAHTSFGRPRGLSEVEALAHPYARVGDARFSERRGFPLSWE